MRNLPTLLRLVLVTLILAAPSLAGTGPETAPDFRDPKRLAITGSETFPVENVLSALMSDFDVALAAHPSAPLRDYLQTLHDKLVIGFRRAGFPNVQVKVHTDFDTGLVHVTIDEGPRYVAGKIVVTGQHDVDADKLIAFLTSPTPPDDARLRHLGGPDKEPVTVWVDKEGKAAEMNDPAWESGEPAPFDHIAQKNLRRQIERALANQGFLSEFRVRLVTQASSPNTLLAIEITDEGPRATLGEITVTGNKIHSRQQIVDYLELKPDMPITADMRAALQHRLWRSGRFIKSKVELGEPSAEDRRVPLRVELVESPWAPKLDEPLSREQKILLKLRDQLVDAKRWPGDLVIKTVDEQGTSRFCISATRGGIWQTQSPSLSMPGYPSHLNASIILTDERFGVFLTEPVRACLDNRRTGTPAARLIGSFRLELLEPDDDSDDTRQILFNIGFTSLEDGEAPQPFELGLDVSPSFIIALPTIAKDTKSSIDDGVLTITSSGERWRIDEATGRLLDYTGYSEETGEPAAVFRFQADAFQNMLDEVSAAVANGPNLFDAKSPWTSWIQLACHDRYLASLHQVTPETLRWLRLARVMQSKGVFDGPGGLNEIIAAFHQPNDKRFSIPFERSGQQDSDVTRVIAYVALLAADNLFSRNSWPWTFSREVTLVLAQHGEHTDATLKQLWSSDRTGPLFYVTISHTLAMINPPAAKMFAAQGLTKLSTEDFQKDCRELLHGDKFIGQCAIRLVRAVRELSPDEVDTILGKRSPKETSMLAEFIRVIRAHPDKPADEALPEALAMLWQSGLRDKVEAQLTAIRDGGQKKKGPTLQGLSH